MRNATLPLAPAPAAVAAENLRSLTYARENGLTVRMTVTKRTDGTVSDRTGTVLAFHGDAAMSNGSVRVATPDGDRTFNLYLIRTLSYVD